MVRDKHSMESSARSFGIQRITLDAKGYLKIGINRFRQPFGIELALTGRRKCRIAPGRRFAGRGGTIAGVGRRCRG